MVTRAERAATCASKAGPGKRLYRGVLIQMNDRIPSGYKGHWHTVDPFAGSVIRGITLRDVMGEINKRIARPSAVERELPPPAPDRREAAYAAAVAAQPPTPWHVEQVKGVWGWTHSIYPSPHVAEGSRMPVARDVSHWHAAVLMAQAPEMAALLKRIADEGKVSAALRGQIDVMLHALRQPEPTTEERPCA